VTPQTTQTIEPSQVREMLSVLLLAMVWVYRQIFRPAFPAGRGKASRLARMALPSALAAGRKIAASMFWLPPGQDLRPRLRPAGRGAYGANHGRPVNGVYRGTQPRLYPPLIVRIDRGVFPADPLAAPRQRAPWDGHPDPDLWADLVASGDTGSWPSLNSNLMSAGL